MGLLSLITTDKILKKEANKSSQEILWLKKNKQKNSVTN